MTSVDKMFIGFTTFVIAVLFVWLMAIQPKEVTAEHKVVELTITIPEAVIQVNKGRIRMVTTATCSGAFISPNGHILTARHCVDSPEIMVSSFDHQNYKAIVIATSAIHDLALLQIARRDTPYFKLARNVIRGEKVSVLGSPLGINDVLAEGVVAKVSGDEILIDCSLLPGNSGGPVMNKNKELIGIGTAGFSVRRGVTHLNIMQSLDSVIFFLNKHLPKQLPKE